MDNAERDLKWDINRELMEATIRTSTDLYSVAATLHQSGLQRPIPSAGELSSLTLPEIKQLTDEIARVVPAGNVPGLILSGLARLEGRTVEPEDSHKYVDLLFRGMRQQVDKAIYGVFFAAPAQVLDAYQKLLRLAGKDMDSAFPEGTWQFYLEFALREDSARHANETTGFHSALIADRIALMDAELLGVWLLAAAEFVRRLPEHLENEWRERVLLRVLADMGEAHKVRKAETLRGLYPLWERQRPFDRGGTSDYVQHRRRLFDAFWRPHYETLGNKAARQFDETMQALYARALPAYQRQMSWLAYLEPGSSHERRTYYAYEEAQIAVVFQGRYYLARLADLRDAGAASTLAQAILTARPTAAPAALDELLVDVRRAEQPALRRQLDTPTQKDLELLRRAPVILNWDPRDVKQPLARIRRGKRGIGDHALTIFRTAESFVFDQSHIFFDGAWGAAVAQIITNEAGAYARAFADQTRVRRAAKQSPYSPALVAPAKLIKLAEAARLPTEASAENATINLAAINEVRGLLRQRSDQLRITVNDLFILYRGLHSILYQPSPTLRMALEKLATDRRAAAQKVVQTVYEALRQAENKNPAILIPIDASKFNPRDRVFPTTFRNPITDFWDYHRRTLDALAAVRGQPGGRKTFTQFDELRGTYLRVIGGFGQLLGRYRDVALGGESLSTASIKFLAHMPGPLRKLIDTIPGQFDVLNEIIKGEEVFSNTGRVAQGASLRRFITAKDDNEQKMFAWGVQTDDADMIRLSLRDFRPYVRALTEAGQQALAQQVVQDYVNAYADGLNAYVRDLREIVVASGK